MQEPMRTCRIPALLLALSPFWLSAPISAEELNLADQVAAITDKMEKKQVEIDLVEQEYNTESQKLQQFRQEIETLKREGDELKVQQNQAKSALDKQYNRLLDDPDTDLASYQKKYQDAWSALKTNQNKLLEKQQMITEDEMRLAQIKQKHIRLNNEVTNLEESKIAARVKRLNSELNESSVVQASYTATCNNNMTIGECSAQSLNLAKQRAVSTFKTQLIDGLTETQVVKQNLSGTQLHITIQENQVIKNGFSNNSDYYTELQTQLQAKPEATTACKLLNVASRYCVREREPAPQTQKSPTKQWANVTVRSNQYGDVVSINGIQYGSTPIEVALPTGKHQIHVSKEGYDTYNRTVTINGSDTIWVKLQPSKGM